MSDLETLARKFALQNALEYQGKASPGPVIGRIMNEMPEMKSKAREVSEVARTAISEVNKMDLAAQKAELEKLAPELLVKEKKEIIRELPALENAENGVVMRLAPNPSGPLHIGHTRMAILNDEYVKRYGGKLIVRMEDTNPPTVYPEAYEMICQDLDWLEVKYHEVVNQSSRFEIYYEYAEKILAAGHGYMCSCESEGWRKMKDESRECPHRNTDPEVNVGIWKRMLAHEFQPHEISMVVKTDINHPNPAVRDFVAMRQVEEPHPLTGTKYKIYPLYNFSVAIDDHLMGMTHVLRGKDHLNNTIRQEYVYDHMDWKKPVFLHYGWVSIEDTVLSTRQIKAAIANGEYSGWDDCRLGTVAALARRGIAPGAIRQYWKDVGTKAVDIRFSWENLYAMNRDIIDADAVRLFFVRDPVEKRIIGIDRLQSSALLHPGLPDMGTREVVLEGDMRVFLTAEDAEGLEPGKILRLKDLGNVEIVDEHELRYVGNDLNVLKKGAKIVHWVGPNSVETTVHMPDGTSIAGIAEKAALDYIGKVAQFERFGFVKLDSADGGGIVAFFTNK
ncbi:MAG: glutamate--tRNA ligase [Candidatus Thermoplasmatota archaeon]|nr:glutamate--tRNA ligase [Euryarchaeota archaeon]MBU4032614.1 glutamate--tRNA ligase [Candidatus Thermoplasmatota archaeon]MBU4072174.1 glutamate--tRNA ligase [Candidatus Thermoplasmatota archaeon]MBU4145024.1 glutamate--tRNA ligase [Candidatus Thermoplasmatota archaeon]MBU4592038.1 glutamate--tRNA ligase [Candidatus Thermoplasmatota archaeon]